METHFTFLGHGNLTAKSYIYVHYIITQSLFSTTSPFDSTTSLGGKMCILFLCGLSNIHIQIYRQLDGNLAIDTVKCLKKVAYHACPVVPLEPV
jgi:hypothetical protein